MRPFISVLALLIAATGSHSEPILPRIVASGDSLAFCCPTVSPDGLKIAYAAYAAAAHGANELWMMDSDGQNAQQLTYSPLSNDTYPAWSPDGNRLVFSSNREGSYDLYILHLDDLVVDRLTQDETDELVPSWSPDGSRIAFLSDATGRGDIYVIEIADSTITQLTFTEEPEGGPSWSPDGSKLVFSSRQTGYGDIYVLNLADGETRRLAGDGQPDGQPVWSPDGRAIVYVGNKDLGMLSSRLVYVDSSGEHQSVLNLYGSITSLSSPSWFPDSESILYLFEEDLVTVRLSEVLTVVTQGTWGEMKSQLSTSPSDRWLRE